MSRFKIGCNFDLNLIKEVVELNKKYPNNVINEFYGSDKEHAFLTARPDFRVQEISRFDLHKYVTLCNQNNITFNYVANSINPGSKRDIMAKLPEIEKWLKFLSEIGVGRITVSNMMMLEIVRNTLPEMPIEISTISNIETVTQVKYLKDKYNIDKVCGGLVKNRNITFLENMATYCNENDVTLDLMVNEFCGVGLNEYATSCTFRQNCYLCHSGNKTVEDAELFNNFPMNRCMSDRDITPGCWLKMRFIRPEDLKLYNSIGVNDFKITGRTGTTEYIVKTAEHYMKESYDGNLLGLWKNLSTILSGESELSCAQPTSINNKKLDGFVNHWFETNKRCDEEICGTTCNYCNEFYENIGK